MKRKLLYLLVLAVFTTNLAYNQYIEDTLTINRTEDPPLIDGYNDWEWDTEEFYTITEYGDDEFDEPQTPDPEDFIAKYKMLWDDEYIYFLGVIVDDFVSDKASLVDAGAPTWETDSWEFYIAPTLSKLPSMEEMTQIRWSYANANLDDATEGVVNGWSSFTPGFTVDDFAEAARTITDDGWILEVKIALAPFAAVIDEGVLTDGSLMGWQITVSDNDGEEFRDWIGSWIPDTQWDEADTLGILKLGSKLTGTVDPVDPIGIDKTQLEARIGFYPNPVAQELRITSNVKIDAIEIYNTVGAMVLRSSNVKDKIDVSDLQTGFYFAKVYTNSSLLKTQKFIKK